MLHLLRIMATGRATPVRSGMLIFCTPSWSAQMECMSLHSCLPYRQFLTCGFCRGFQFRIRRLSIILSTDLSTHRNGLHDIMDWDHLVLLVDPCRRHLWTSIRHRSFQGMSEAHLLMIS